MFEDCISRPGPKQANLGSGLGWLAHEHLLDGLFKSSKKAVRLRFLNYNPFRNSFPYFQKLIPFDILIGILAILKLFKSLETLKSLVDLAWSLGIRFRSDLSPCLSLSKYRGTLCLKTPKKQPPSFSFKYLLSKAYVT